jgi:hypothetical protein
LSRIIDDELPQFEMSLSAFSLYFVCPACGAQPQTECAVIGTARRCAPHGGRLDIARGYQESMRRLAGFAKSGVIQTGNQRARVHRLGRRSSVRGRRAA